VNKSSFLIKKKKKKKKQKRKTQLKNTKRGGIEKEIKKKNKGYFGKFFIGFFIKLIFIF